MTHEKFPVPGSWLVPDHCKLLLVLLFSSVQPLNRVRLFATPWTAACQASLSITNSCSLLKLIQSSKCCSTPELKCLKIPARKGRGHVGSWTYVPSGSEGNPRWERGHRGVGMACRMGMTQWLKDAYLSSTRTDYTA